MGLHRLHFSELMDTPSRHIRHLPFMPRQDPRITNVLFHQHLQEVIQYNMREALIHIPSISLKAHCIRQHLKDQVTNQSTITFDSQRRRVL